MLKQLLKKKFRFYRNVNNSYLDTNAIEKIIGYKFKNKNLLNIAFTHKSYLTINNKHFSKSNERLEFLGDAVLEIVVTEYLYTRLPDKSEGELSKLKSVLVSGKVLAKIVAKLQIGNFLLLNRGEEKTGGRDRMSNLANLYESIIGAIYLDRGIVKASRFVAKTLLISYEEFTKHKNYKSILLEYSQSKGFGSPVYNLVETNGPDHNKQFVIDVVVNNTSIARGTGKSKKSAEQDSAHNLIKIISPHLISEFQPY